MAQSIEDDLKHVSGFLARRDVEELSVASLGGPVDAIVLLGSSCLESVEVAARAVSIGISQRVVISGGMGHSTSYLCENVRARGDLRSIPTENRGEAEIFADILRLHFGVPEECLVVESISTNCGGNAWETKRLLEEHQLQLRSALLIQDPTMQRRTHASFERAWRGEDVPRFLSYAAFLPEVVEIAGELSLAIGCGAWKFPRFVSLVLGEIPRLFDGPDGYGPQGSDYIEHVDIPVRVLEACGRLANVFPQFVGR